MAAYRVNSVGREERSAKRAAPAAHVAWLRSPAGGPTGWFSGNIELVASNPVAVLEQYQGRPATLRIGEHVVAEHPSGWELWRQLHRELRSSEPCPLPAGPGWIGYVGFESARLLERLPATVREPLGLPLMRLGLFDAVILVDRRRGRTWRVEAPWVRARIEARSAKRGAGSLGQATERRSDVCQPRAAGPHFFCQPGVAGPHLDLRSSDFALPAAGRLVPDLSQHAYERMIARALEYIRAGDVYQVNLAQRFVIEPVPDAAAIFDRLQRVNPAPYAALIRWPGRAVVSASPELLLACRRGRLRTCPIKGTRPRAGDERLDRAAIEELLASGKEAAELTMIVDLHRNDLGRVCRTGSVRVAAARRLEAHPTVYHTVAEVTGMLRDDCDAIDALAASFPAGSVTGVPKIRAIEIIDELEPVARGAYCGAIGHLGLDGDATFSVAIRTLQLTGARATLYVGGGIVVESDPAAEYAETLAKARGILAALGVETPAAELRRAAAEVGAGIVAGPVRYEPRVAERKVARGTKRPHQDL